jgi:hypothetical protein
MDILEKLHSLLGNKPQQGKLMQVNRNGSHGPSSQGHLPPAQQQDTWMSNDPRAMRPPAQAHPNFRAVPNSPQQQMQYRLQMPQRPQFKRFEDGSMIMGNTSLPAYDSIDDFTGRRF